MVGSGPDLSCWSWASWAVSALLAMRSAEFSAGNGRGQCSVEVGGAGGDHLIGEGVGQLLCSAGGVRGGLEGEQVALADRRRGHLGEDVAGRDMQMQRRDHGLGHLRVGHQPGGGEGVAGGIAGAVQDGERGERGVARVGGRDEHLRLGDVALGRHVRVDGGDGDGEDRAREDELDVLAQRPVVAQDTRLIF